MSLAKFIAGIPKDKKAHLILGLILNPIIFALSIVIFSNPLVGFLACLGVHAFVEVHQWLTKTGKPELLDFLAGSYSAIVIYLMILIN